uniref:uncharacterized protein LOC128930933 n=1 Tax=Callithrix jacchus TaxID=9483 RepID=UPI0023DCF3E8|nr:uncharacterized protein LOC128930933 [Callithrix jacchus]
MHLAGMEEVPLGPAQRSYAGESKLRCSLKKIGNLTSQGFCPGLPPWIVQPGSGPGTRPQPKWRRRPQYVKRRARRPPPALLLSPQPEAEQQSRKPDFGVRGGLGSARAVVWLHGGAAGRDAVPPGEPVMEVQGAGQPLELPRRLLRRPAPGLPGAVVAAAAAFGPTLDMQVLSSFKNICQDSRLWHFCQLGVAQMGCDLARVVDPGPAEKSGAEDWQCPLLCHSEWTGLDLGRPQTCELR